MTLSSLFVLLFTLTVSCYAAPSEISKSTGTSLDAICNSCKHVENFSKKLVSNETYEETKENLIEWCQNTGRGANLKVCSYLIKDTLTALDRVASDFFCERIKACPEESPVDYMTVGTDNTSCDFCINTMNHLRDIVTAPQTEAEFRLQIGKACTYVRSFKSECIQLADENLDNLFEYLKKVMNPQVLCEQSGYCSKDFDARPREYVGDIAGVINIGPVQILPSENDEIIPFYEIEKSVVVSNQETNNMNCLICKQVAEWAIQKLKDNRTEVAIIQALDEVCDTVFPQSKQPQCESFVKQYADEIIGILKQENDPNLVCILLGVCGQKIQNNVPKSDANVEMNAICDYCLNAANWINKQIGDNRTEDNIKAALTQVCKVIAPKDKIIQCEEIVREKVDEIVENLVNCTDPNAFCSTVKLCPPSKPFRELESETEHSTEVSLYPTCFLCKKIISWINNEIKDNRTDEAIVNTISGVCSVFSHEIDDCNMFIAKWSYRILLALKQVTEPQLACELMMVCMEQSNDLERNEAPETHSIANEVNKQEGWPEKSGTCFECQTIAHFIQVQLYDYKKEENIREWVIKNVCDRAPNPIPRDTCESFINEYGDSVLQLIAMRAFDPKVLCENELKLCPQSASPEFELVQPSKAEMCDICIQTVKQLDGILSVEVIDQEISHLASKVCNHIDIKERPVCSTIIETYGPYFLQMIGRLNNPKQVCKAVDMCFIAGEVHLLGGHKCTFGPTYWCHTTAHADACKATDYCKRKVWTPIQ